MSQRENLIPRDLQAKIRSAAASVGLSCERADRIYASDVLSWLDEQGWSWEIEHDSGFTWTCLVSRDTWPGLVHRRLNFLSQDHETLGEAVATGLYYVLACGAIARERRRWDNIWQEVLRETSSGLRNSAAYDAGVVDPDRTRVLRRAFLLAGLRWPFNGRVPVPALLAWLEACGWRVMVRGGTVEVGRLVRVGDQTVRVENSFEISPSDGSLVEPVCTALHWVFSIAGCDLKPVALHRDEAYGRMEPVATAMLLGALGDRADRWPFGLSPSMFDVVRWLEKQGLEWNLSRDNIPEHVMDDPEWRGHKWGLVISQRSPDIGVAYWGETLSDMFVTMFRDVLGGEDTGTELPDFDDPPEDGDEDLPSLDDDEIMEVIMGADRRFEPPPWMVEYVMRMEQAGY